MNTHDKGFNSVPGGRPSAPPQGVCGPEGRNLLQPRRAPPRGREARLAAPRCAHGAALRWQHLRDSGALSGPSLRCGRRSGRCVGHAWTDSQARWDWDAQRCPDRRKRLHQPAPLPARPGLGGPLRGGSRLGRSRAGASPARARSTHPRPAAGAAPSELRARGPADHGGVRGAALQQFLRVRRGQASRLAHRARLRSGSLRAGRRWPGAAPRQHSARDDRSPGPRRARLSLPLRRGPGP